MTQFTLDDLLSPFPAASFFEQHYEREFTHGIGKPGRFAALMPWEALNQILRHQRMDGRLRMFRDGKKIEPESYLDEHLGSPALSPGRMNRHLRDGATLILDAVEESYEPVLALAEDLEYRLRARIQVNLYASWRVSRGFDVHWDRHDVFVLQIAGQKDWKIYGSTREHPLGKDIEPNTKPPEKPIWEGTLTDGSWLYLPRGCWHVAIPVNEPTLHLTIGIHKPSGIDFLTWYADTLRNELCIRQDLPVLANPEGRRTYLASLREVMIRGWSEDLLDRYQEDVESTKRPRPSLTLPRSVGSDVLPEYGERWSVKWNAPRPVVFRRDPAKGGVSFACSGRKWRFSGTCAPLLHFLQEKRVCTAAEVYQFGSESLDRMTIRTVLDEFIREGLVVYLPETSGAASDAGDFWAAAAAAEQPLQQASAD